MMILNCFALIGIALEYLPQLNDLRLDMQSFWLPVK